MNINRNILCALFVASSFCSLAAMEPSQEPAPMEIDQPVHVAPAIEQLGDLPTAMIVEDLAWDWIETHSNLRGVALEVIRRYGGVIGQAVSNRIREIVGSSIVLVNNSRHVSTVTLDLQIAGTQPIQVTLNPGERRVIEFPQNIREGLGIGIRMLINASFQVPPTWAPIKPLKNLETVAGGGRIIISQGGIRVQNIIQPTLPPLRRQRARINLLEDFELQ